MSQPPASFRSTSWSLVLRARHEQTTRDEDQRALGELCERYWPPLYASIRREGFPREEAEDLTQAFLAGVLSRGDLERVDPERGRFRSYLRGALRHFLQNARRDAQRRKRGGDWTRSSLDFEDAERRLLAPREGQSPDEAFARDWALCLLQQSLDDLREDARARDRLAVFEVLEAALTPGQAPPIRELAEAAGLSESATKVALHRLRQRYRAAIHRRILDTVADPDEVEDEIRALFAALGGG